MSLDERALRTEITQLKKELFNLRLNASTMQVKDNSQFKKLRAQVARAFTVLNERKQSNA